MPTNQIRAVGVLCGISVAVAFGALGSAARASDDELRSTLQSRYAAMKAAMAAHDGSAVSAILSPDFTSIDVSGKTETARQMISEVNALKPDSNKVSTTKLRAMSVVVGKATIDQTYDMKTKRRGADGAIHAVEFVTRSTDTWITFANTWLIQRTVTKEISVFTDGKQMMHKVTP